MRTVPVDRERRRPGRLPRPDRLHLQLGIAAESRDALLREAEIERVAEARSIVVQLHAEPQGDGPATDDALDSVRAVPHGATDLLRARPEGRVEPALPCDGDHDLVAAARSEKSQRTVQRRLADTVGAGHDRQPAEREHEVAE